VDALSGQSSCGQKVSVLYGADTFFFKPFCIPDVFLLISDYAQKKMVWKKSTFSIPDFTKPLRNEPVGQ
jgi:hypothetical protein